MDQHPREADILEHVRERGHVVVSVEDDRELQRRADLPSRVDDFGERARIRREELTANVRRRECADRVGGLP